MNAAPTLKARNGTAHLLVGAHLSFLRGVGATVMVLVLVCALAPPPPPAQAVTVDLEVPDLPASPIRVVDLRCEEGQSDLNRAGMDELRAVLGVSEPIAQRVVDTRPHYGVEDLLVVEGIGPGRVAKFDSSALCATPVTVDGLVPVIPEFACKSGEVDAATAPRSMLEASPHLGGLGLSRPVADRLLARRDVHPFPTLEHLTVVEGVGDGKLKQWQLDGSICLTPAPFVATSADRDTYKAALFSDARGEAVALESPAGTFALGVPAGVLDQQHAWATVVDVPDGKHRGPRADFTIHGTWQGNGDQVYVTVPSDPFVGAVPTVPAVMLGPGSPNSEFHLRSRLADHGDAWTIATEHLTPAEAASQFAFLVIYLPSDRADFEDQSEAWARKHITELTADPPTCNPDITAAPRMDVRTLPGSLMTDDNALNRPIFQRCVEGNSQAERVRFTFANSSAFAYLLPGDTAYPTVDLIDTSFSGDVVSQALFESQDIIGPRLGHDETASVLPPTASLHGSLSFPRDRLIGVTFDRLSTSAYWGARTVGAVMGPAGAAAVAGANCVKDFVSQGVGLNTLVSCAETAGDQGAQAVSRAFAFLDSAHTLQDALAVSASRIGFAGVDGAWYFDRDRPPTPPPAGGGHGEGTNPDGGPDGTIVTDAGIGIPHDVYGHGVRSGSVYVAVDDSGVAYSMNLANPEHYLVYDCLAERYPMRSYLPVEKLADYGHFSEAAYPPDCDESIPVRETPPDATNFILREENGTAWFIDDNSDLRWIPDGGTFICLAQRYYVLDHTPWETIQSFEDAVYAGDATCP